MAVSADDIEVTARLFRPPTPLLSSMESQGHFSNGRLTCSRDSSASPGVSNLCEGISPRLAPISKNAFQRNVRGRQQKFIEWMKPAVRYWGMITGIPPSLILAQAIDESGFGSSPRFRNQNNLFSIYCGRTPDRLNTVLGAVPVKKVSCRGRAERGHSGSMTTPEDYNHALLYYLNYLTDKMKTIYPILNEEVQAAKRKGPFEIASVESLLRVRGREKPVKCGGKWVRRPVFALTKYACGEGYRNSLNSHVKRYAASLDTQDKPCRDCLNQKFGEAVPARGLASNRSDRR